MPKGSNAKAEVVEVIKPETTISISTTRELKQKAEVMARAKGKNTSEFINDLLKDKLSEWSDATWNTILSTR